MTKIEELLDDLTDQITTVYIMEDGAWGMSASNSNAIMKLLESFYNEAYERGYSDGEEEDCLVKYEEGYAEGYEVGKEEGYVEGYDECLDIEIECQ